MTTDIWHTLQQQKSEKYEKRGQVDSTVFLPSYFSCPMHLFLFGLPPLLFCLSSPEAWKVFYTALENCFSTVFHKWQKRQSSIQASGWMNKGCMSVCTCVWRLEVRKKHRERNVNASHAWHRATGCSSLYLLIFSLSLSLSLSLSDLSTSS